MTTTDEAVTARAWRGARPGRHRGCAMTRPETTGDAVERIAADLRASVDTYHADHAREAFEARQRALWDEARTLGCDLEVARTLIGYD